MFQTVHMSFSVKSGGECVRIAIVFNFESRRFVSGLDNAIILRQSTSIENRNQSLHSLLCMVLHKMNQKKNEAPAHTTKL